MSKPSVKGKFKSFFGRKNGGTSSSNNDDKDLIDFIFSNDILNEIGPDSSVLIRTQTLKDLCEVVKLKCIEEYAVESLLKAIEDLFSENTSIESRHAAFLFTICLTHGQFHRLGFLRSNIFRLITDHPIEEDLPHKITLLKELTDNGKDVSYCEQVGSFLISFMSDALYATNSDEFLNLLVNIVHYNSSVLDKEMNSALVRKTCDFCNNANGEKDIENCLLLLDATIRFGGFSSGSLFPVIETLCRTVNIEKFCQLSWKLMRNLVGTKLGHTAVYIMCQILEDNNKILEIALLRGAVFFIGMSIWGSRRVPSLHYTPIHVLPSFKISLQTNNFNVGYEISLSIQRVVRKFGADQEFITWDIILEIVEILHNLAEGHHNKSEQSLLKNILQSLLTNIEQLFIENRYKGSPEKLFKLISSCSNDRPDVSMNILLKYYEEQIDPEKDDWLILFQSILEKYFQDDKRTFVRVKVLKLADVIFSKYKYTHENELVELIVSRSISNAYDEKDENVRMAIAQLCSELLNKSSSKKYPAILNAIEIILTSIKNVTVKAKDSLQDFEIIINTLIISFQEKLLQPHNVYVAQIFKLLVKHINEHYVCNIASFTGGIIRNRIFSLLLSVRANSNHFIGLTANGQLKYSTHAIFKSSLSTVNDGYGKLWLIDCDFQAAFDVILKCLKNELDWLVLEYVLKNLSSQLENKSLYIHCQCNMNKLSSALCNLINDRTYLNKVKNCPSSMGMSELRNLIFPILSVLATYHLYLSKDRQRELIHCMEFGLNTYCAQTCVLCLTICTLEMQSVMISLLPSILVKLSQISATVHMASPILEFLSTLKETPLLYANFVEEQYMSIFAMALPYTDSFKYNLYTVTLAHQVIADWFTRCRLKFRKGFVTLIAKALKCGPYRDSDNLKNEKELDKKQLLFHYEMTEVCLDMMARHTFSPNMNQPKRSPLAEFLLRKGITQTWFVGNMLISITTSCGVVEECNECELQTKLNTDSVEDSSHLLVSMTQTNNISTTFDDVQPEPNISEKVPPVAVTAESCISKINSIDVVTAALESWDSSNLYEETDEVGSDATPLVDKLTSDLASNESTSEMPLFSPSEQLLFSRQASKAFIPDNYEDGEDLESDASVCEEEYFSDDVYSGYDEDRNSPNITKKSPFYKNNEEETFMKQQSSKQVFEKSSVNNTPSVSVGNCQCACDGWAEVYIRRPTSNFSWIMKISNTDMYNSTQLSDLSALAFNLEGIQLSHKIDTFLGPMFEWTDKMKNSKQRNNTMSFSTIPDVRSSRSVSDSSSNTTEATKKYSPPKRRHSTGSITVTAKCRGTFLQNFVGQQAYEQQNELKRDKTAAFKTLSNPVYRIESPECEHSPTHQPYHNKRKKLEKKDEKMLQKYLCPNLIFLQLFYSSSGYKLDRPAVVVEPSEIVDRAVKILDRFPCVNTHKFGVLYVAKGQENNEQQILSNEFGSPRYTDFLSGLGELVNLKECVSADIYTGGLDCNGTDGKFAYIWKDETTHVAFHVATLMPNKKRDKQCTSKKLHIGNDFITIIYDDSKHGYTCGTIKGQFSSAEIVIRPLEYNGNKVIVRKRDAGSVVDIQAYVISDNNLPMLIRKVAIHTNMAVVTELSDKFTYNNWLERLRQIKSIKTKAIPPDAALVESGMGYDFTSYT